MKYILKRNQSDVLVVIFGALTIKPRYAYIRTLINVKTNKLFILYNFGCKLRGGSYYLGENGDFFVEKMVIELIEQVKEKVKANKVILLGSSKGGYASLYFGLKYNADCIICGAPQYLLGDYLNTEWHRPILKSITGNSSDQSISKLNKLLPTIINNSNRKPKIYLHYSINEHTYKEHIIYLLKDLEANKYKIEELDIKDYELHEDVGFYFPKFIKDVILKESDF